MRFIKRRITTCVNMKILKNLKISIISFEALTLPGEQISYHNHGLATNLLKAISEFEDAFLEYME